MASTSLGAVGGCALLRTIQEIPVLRSAREAGGGPARAGQALRDLGMGPGRPREG